MPLKHCRALGQQQSDMSQKVYFIWPVTDLFYDVLCCMEAKGVAVSFIRVLSLMESSDLPPVQAKSLWYPVKCMQ